MAREWDRRFSEIVNELEALELAYVNGKLDRPTVERKVGELMAQMSEEQLEAHREYEKERLRQAEETIAEVRAHLKLLLDESERRKRGGAQ